MKVGFIGLGIMGQPMALNLVKAGFDLTVYNRTAKKCQPLKKAGAAVADSLQQVAEQCDVIIAIVSDTPDVEEVLFGPNGVYHGLSKGKIVVDMSTISPTETQAFAARLAEKGADMIDAPVSGGDVGAVKGTLAIMCGGPQDAYDKCLPLFEAMGKNIILVGGNGHGQITKMVNQVIGACNVLSMVEGMRLAVRSGINAEKALEVVTQGAAGSWMLDILAPRVLNNDYDPGFMIKLQSKDLRLVMELADSLQLVMPLGKHAHQLFKAATDTGYGDLGTQGMFKFLED